MQNVELTKWDKKKGKLTFQSKSGDGRKKSLAELIKTSVGKVKGQQSIYSN